MLLDPLRPTRFLKAGQFRSNDHNRRGMYRVEGRNRQCVFAGLDPLGTWISYPPL